MTGQQVETMPRKSKIPGKITSPTRRSRKPGPEWTGERVKALREHLGLTQVQFAEELGILQQTVSVWELGYHVPKGASVKVLNLVAERAKFKYGEARDAEKGS